MPRALITLGCGALFAVVPAAPACATTHDWTRFGFDAARSNSSSAFAGIGAGDLAHLKRQDVQVPGTVDSSPIYLHDVQVAGKRRDVFIATTSYGRTFALAARTGKRLWTFSPSSVGALEGTHQITHSSPLADRSAGVVYAASPDGRIRKLSLKDGKQVTSGSWPATITRDASHEKIGTALNLAGKHVIATTGGYTTDTPPYQGHVVLIDRVSGTVVRVFNSLCSDRGGIIDPPSCSESGSAIWARSGAVVVPGSHRILVATGDGNFNGTTNWGDSVLELSPDLTRLVGNWTPTNESLLDSGDLDLGTTAPALLRAGSRWLALQGGKDAQLRLLDVANLNGHGKACACKGAQLQTLSAPGPVFAAPAVWRSNGRTWAFVTGLFGGTAGFRLDQQSNPKLHLMWSNGRTGTSPVIAGGLLYVYSPADGRVTVYRPASGKAIGALQSSPGHWSSPIVADGRVAIPTGDANDHATSGTITIYRKP